MMLFNRAVIISELDPVPSGMRVTPGALVISRREAEEINRGEDAPLRALERAVRRAELGQVKRIIKRIG